jgi:hypothetical protein
MSFTIPIVAISGYGDDTKFRSDIDKDTFRPGKDIPPIKRYGRLSRLAPASLSGERSRAASSVRRIIDAPVTPQSVQMPRSEPTFKMIEKDGEWVKVTT